MRLSNLPNGCLSGDIEPSQDRNRIDAYETCEDAITGLWREVIGRLPQPEPMIKAMLEAQDKTP